MFSLAILACAVFASVAAQRTVPCAGGIQDGATVAQGIYWYQCTGGQLVVQGCVSTTGTNIKPGDTFINDKNIEITCVKDANAVKFQQTACMFNSQRILPGATAADPTAWYICDRSGDTYLLWHKGGCVYKGQQVAFNAQSVDGVTVYQCVQTQGSQAQMVVTGCAGANGQHALGDEYQDAKQLYNCDLDTTNPQMAMQRVVGCISPDGQKYYDYQTFQVGQQLFRCVVAPNQAKAEPVVCGCVQRLPQKPVSQKLLGCSWEEEDETSPATQGYIVKCVLDNNNSAFTVRDTCIVSAADGHKFNLQGGCYRQVGADKIVACMKGSGPDKDVAIKYFSSSSPELNSLSNTC